MRECCGPTTDEEEPTEETIEEPEEAIADGGDSDSECGCGPECTCGCGCC